MTGPPVGTPAPQPDFQSARKELGRVGMYDSQREIIYGCLDAAEAEIARLRHSESMLRYALARAEVELAKSGDPV